MMMDMSDVKEAMKDPRYTKFLRECAAISTVIEYRDEPGKDGDVHIEGAMPVLFAGACEILKRIVIMERPERRKDLLDLIHEQVSGELKEEGYL